MIRRSRGPIGDVIRACWVAALLLLPGAEFLGSAAGESAEEQAEPSVEDTLVRSARIASRGLEYLAKNQNEDRSFSVERSEDVTRAPLAVTALSALAFMAGGSTMGRGPYRQQVRDAIEYLLDHQVDKPPEGERGGADGALKYGYFLVESDSTSKMHGHGFATLAVSQAYGMLGIDASYGDSAGPKAREDLRRMRVALAGAVRLIERSQSEQGGWYYQPYENDHEGSMTVLMIQALRAARNVGVDVDKGVIDRAVKYLDKSQRREDGAFRYHLNSPQVSFALTAAAVATLNAAGTYDSEVIDRGIEYMRRHDPLLNPDQWAADQNFPYYARLYAAQAYYVYRDQRLWREWHRRIIRDLENKQNAITGHFGGGQYGSVYATAMSCLVLQIPFQYLPIFQK
ncbi:MAG: hypothetical protein V2A76_19460 [Planctomycetota bacterium]